MSVSGHILHSLSMQSRTIIILALLPCFCFAEIFFHSDFEQGQSYLAKSTDSAQNTVRLLEGSRVEEWPVQGGSGIIEFNLSKRADTFSYAHRERTALKGVKGLRHAHPKWAGIRTLGYKQWYTSAGYWKRAPVKGIRAEAANPIAGAFSALIDFDTDSVISLTHKLETIPAETLFCRLFVRLSQRLLGHESDAYPFLYLKTKTLTYPGIIPRKSRNASGTFFDLSKPPRSKIISKRTFSGFPGLEAYKSYCLEIGIRHASSGTILTRLWVNGTLACQMHTAHTPLPSRLPALSIGKLLSSHSLDGRIWFDDLTLSTERLGPIPPKPTIVFENNSLRSSSPEAYHENMHAASHWQISASNSWLLPLFNTGGIRDKLTLFPDLCFFEISDSLNRRLKYPQPFAIPTGVVSGKNYFARVRHCFPNGSWSDWSVPAGFAVSVAESIPPEPVPQIRDAWFSRLNKKKRLKTIHPGQWYDLHIHFRSSTPSPAFDQAFIDINCSGAPENSAFSYGNRADAFDAKRNYHTSLSLGTKCGYIKQQEKSSNHEELCGRKGLYFDDSEGQYRQDLAKGEVRIRTRLLEQAHIGPWKLSVFMKEDGRGLSPVFAGIFHVQNRKKEGDVSGSTWALHGILLAAGAFLLWGWQRLRRSVQAMRRRSSTKPGNSLPTMSEHVTKAIGHMQEHYKTPILPRDVASAIGVSPNWLGKLFKHETGANLVDYLAELRIEEAKRLLRETKMDVSEIAFKSGFNSMTSFRRTFRDFEKRTPLSYRNKAD